MHRSSILPTEKISKGSSSRRYIAVCIVIVDDLYHEEIWKRWCTDSQNFGAELFIHAKYPAKIESPWVKERLVERTFDPEWNSPEVVRAMLELLSSAISKQNRTIDGEFERFIFATESCIPICSLEDAGRLLFEESKSWLQAYDIPKSRWEQGWCFESVDRRVIPREVKFLFEIPMLFFI